MKNLIVIAVVIINLLVFTKVSTGNNFDEIWKSLENETTSEARKLLEQALKNPELKTQAGLCLMLLNSFEEKGDNLKLINELYESLEDPSPYLFALWYDNTISDGDFSTLSKEQLAFNEKVLNDSKINGSIKAATNYMLAIYNNKIYKAKQRDDYFSKMQSVRNYQVTGPFDNTSGSGFDKIYDPVKYPQNDKTFFSKYNSAIHWFVPQGNEHESWMTTYYSILTIKQ
jgi:hypothetical protein